jgi:hypothetical protein
VQHRALALLASRPACAGFAALRSPIPRDSKISPDVLEHRHEALTEGVELLSRVPDLAHSELAVRREGTWYSSPSGSQSPDFSRRRMVSSYCSVVTLDAGVKRARIFDLRAPVVADGTGSSFRLSDVESGRGEGGSAGNALPSKWRGSGPSRTGMRGASNNCLRTSSRCGRRRDRGGPVGLVSLECVEVVAAPPGEIAAGERGPFEPGGCIGLLVRRVTSALVFPVLDREAAVISGGYQCTGRPQTIGVPARVEVSVSA